MQTDMKAIITLENKRGQIDLSKPMAIHLPIKNEQKLGAWYVGPPSVRPHINGDFVGSIAAGASVNFNDISFNPHAHGTHTECVGHIIAGHYEVLASLGQFIFEALLVSVAPVNVNGDWQITKDLLVQAFENTPLPKAVVIRTLPNEDSKKQTQYSHTNPAYFTETAAAYLCAMGVDHLIVDLPSVDREKDQGALLAHKAFWNVHGTIRTQATISEFAFIPNNIIDGRYMLQFGLAPFENDASPSTLVLYEFESFL